ncbi:helix-turn-helix transcriptional regulator [Massilia sp. IC2-477]|uniref:ATP-binding protein n=1 Tax=Massilia sp. IC2-477 TaxID=2887198 RepID=UPI001D11BBEB|nr:winged helix-turn-helix domain-containing protein [Massilia sp. IC2-477]MCC2957554.1 helix-turn-helix transcriptional regulator [Massilia sp. IC2-477]
MDSSTRAARRADLSPLTTEYVFGDFRLYPARKLLLLGERQVPLGGRAFDLLVALVIRAGEVLSHHELLTAVWPSSVVEENGLRVQLSALRKILGESKDEPWIVTLPGRGYSFVRPVELRVSVPARDSGQPWSLPGRAGSGGRITRLLGREALLAELAGQTAGLLTLTGPGGIGKSALALAHADERRGRHADGVYCVDFASIRDPALATAAVGTALGVSLQAGEPLAGICRALQGMRALLVFDNCEHVLQAVAEIAARIGASSKDVRILATSREPLGIAGELVKRVTPLALPEHTDSLGIEEALAAPAIALFVERAVANSHRFVLTRENLPTVLELCRQLDGLPLAIELAAARIEALGVDGLMARLNDMFGLLTRSRRLADARHAALDAMLDCSFRLLDDVERAVLLRASVFHAPFSLEAAVVVCESATLAPSAVVDAVLALEEKSLLARESEHGVARYRCPNITRRYAAARLLESGAAGDAAHRHARHLHAVFVGASDGIIGRSLPQWQRQYGGLSADLMAALDWSFGPGGDAMLGVELCASVPLQVIELGMIGAFCARIETALGLLDGMAGGATQRIEARLACMWALATTHVSLPRERRTPIDARLARIRDEDVAPDERPLIFAAMCVSAFSVGDYARVVRLAERARSEGQQGAYRAGLSGQLLQLLADRWSALGLHYRGLHRQAREYAIKTLESGLPSGSTQALGPISLRVAIGVLLARIDWFEGAADAAMARALQVASVAEDEHPLGLAMALGLGVAPIALWRGDESLARETVERLDSLARRHALSFWCEWARYLRALVPAGDAASERQDDGLDIDAAPPMMLELFASVRPDLLSDALLAGAAEGLWCGPEAARAMAERAHAKGTAPIEVESGLARAFVQAQAQGALAWELRCATSLARLWEANARADEAGSLLHHVLIRFHQGYESADLRAARALQEHLAGVRGGNA